MSTSDTQFPLMLDARDAYARWAPSYDDTPNPLTALEERLLVPTVREFSGRDIVDLGCGTGRWLHRLQSIAPRSLAGIDVSSAMLAQAGKKCLLSTRLIEADCTSTPLSSRSADCVLASFVLSYVQDIGRFAAEAARILRPGGALIVSDLHPDTPTYGWRRTFRAAGSVFEVGTFCYTLGSLITEMKVAGLALEQLAEASFGEEEATIFRASGKVEYFQRVASLPVIYIARFSRGVD
ncbi:MAG: class I SAM-dependent methyltransferase [Acidobacteriaceae bacterium]|nr:class I SAM-dependent methyltransferase [Acidobacteriaceae bacterium]